MRNNNATDTDTTSGLKNGQLINECLYCEVTILQDGHTDPAATEHYRCANIERSSYSPLAMAREANAHNEYILALAKFDTQSAD